MTPKNKKSSGIYTDKPEGKKSIASTFAKRDKRRRKRLKEFLLQYENKNYFKQEEEKNEKIIENV